MPRRKQAAPHHRPEAADGGLREDDVVECRSGQHQHQEGTATAPPEQPLLVPAPTPVKFVPLSMDADLAGLADIIAAPFPATAAASAAAPPGLHNDASGPGCSDIQPGQLAVWRSHDTEDWLCLAWPPELLGTSSSSVDSSCREDGGDARIRPQVMLGQQQQQQQHCQVYFKAPHGAEELLLQGHLGVSVQQLTGKPALATTSAQDGSAAGLLTPGIITFSCSPTPLQCTDEQTCAADVLWAPPPAAVHAAVERCRYAAPRRNMTAAAAAATAEQDDNKELPECAVPLLPALHVSQRASVAAPWLLHPPSCSALGHGGASTATAGEAGGCSSAPRAPVAAGQQLWRLRIGVTAAGLEALRARSADDVGALSVSGALQQPQRGLSAAMHWLVPHWVPHISGAPTPSTAAGGSSSSSDGSAARRGGNSNSGGAQQQQPFDAAKLYAAVKPSGAEALLDRRPPELLPQLRPYQRRAAAWMIMREAGGRDGAPLLHPLWRTAQLLSPWRGEKPVRGRGGAKATQSSAQQQLQQLPALLYVNPYSCLLALEPWPVHSVRGGILADEMGLGKTVELLALIASNRFVPPKAEQQQDQLEHDKQQQQQQQQQQRVAEVREDRHGSCCGRCGEEFQGPRYTQDGWIEDPVGGPSNAKRRRMDSSPTPAGAATTLPPPLPVRKRQRAVSVAAVESGVGDVDSCAVVDRQRTRRPRNAQGNAASAPAGAKPGAQQLHGTGHRGAKRRRAAAATPGSPQLGDDSDEHQDKQQQQDQQRGARPPARAASLAAGRFAGSSDNGSDSMQSNSGSESESGCGGGSDPEWGVTEAEQSNDGPGLCWGARSARSRSRQPAEGQQQQQQQASRQPAHAGNGAGGRSATAAGQLLCSSCLRDLALQQVSHPCGTTLIVVPPGILVQWVDELAKHIAPGTLSLRVYVGQSQLSAGAAPDSGAPPRTAAGARAAATAAVVTSAAAAAAAAGRVITAADLAAADIVLTTYDVLSRELALQPGEDEAAGRTMRQRKRYAVVPTPLTRLSFWRLVLDEAQAVRGSTARASAMARRIRAEHRWAVTGTPISGGLQDLAGLLSCLGAQPWAGDARWWRAAIERPLACGNPAGLAALLDVARPARGGVLWRSAKADVLHEMGLPGQQQHSTLLRLSAIERHWYTRTHSECAGRARAVLQDSLAAAMVRGAPELWSGKRADARDAARPIAAAAITAIADGREPTGAPEALAALRPLLSRPLLPPEQHKLLLPLLRLRQACIHPQVGAAGLRSALAATSGAAGGGAAPGQPMSMDEVLLNMIGKARTEAEEAQRQLLGAINGLAGVAWLRGEAAGAAASYRRALAISSSNRLEVRTDQLQRLHTLHNLRELLVELAQQSGCPGPEHRLEADSDGKGSSDPAAVPYATGVGREPDDMGLAREASDIRAAYVAQRAAELASAHKAYAKLLPDALPVPSGGSSRQRSTVQRNGGARRGRGAAAAARVWARALVDDGSDCSSSDGFASEDEDEADTGVASLGASWCGWFLPVLDTLQAAGRGDDTVRTLKGRLIEDESYRRKAERNASSLARRFGSLPQLKLLLVRELGRLAEEQGAVAGALERLHAACTAPGGPPSAIVEAAGSCRRCRPGAMRVRERVCEACRIDEAMRRWEVRLFALDTRAMMAGQQVDADDAARYAQEQAMRFVNQGGLQEDQAEHQLLAAEAGAAVARRRDGVVAGEQVLRRPSDTEVVLRLLKQQLGRAELVKLLPPGVAEAAAQHIDAIEASRRLFAAAGALIVAQRHVLQAQDEVNMATLRITTRLEGEQVTEHEALFKLTAAEQVSKAEQLELERAVADADLARCLGKLRYLRTLAAARRRAAAAAADAARREAERQAAASGAGAAVVVGGADRPDSARNAAAEAALRRANAATAAGAAAPAPACAAAATSDPSTSTSITGGNALAAATPMLASSSTASAPPAVAPAVAPTVVDDDDALEQSCPVCHDDVTAAAAVLPCGHVLCCSCADALVAQHRVGAPRINHHTPGGRVSRIACPTCRSSAHVADVAYVDSECGSAARSYVCTDSATAAPPGGAAAAAGTTTVSSDGVAVRADGDGTVCPWVDERSLTLTGSCGAKVDAVVRRLTHLLQSDAGCQVVVFSAWADALDVLSHALRTNGLAHAYGHGRRGFMQALEAFKGTGGGAASGGGGAPGELGFCSASTGRRGGGRRGRRGGAGARPAAAAGPSKDSGSAAALDAAAGVVPALALCDTKPRVLLLLVSQGAAGLNLTEAAHVVLLEPLLDPAQELQACGRVSRFGQTRTTHVHRFVVQHTVEENVAALMRQRAAAMDMGSARVSSAGADGADLTVRDAVALISSAGWSDSSGSGAGT